MSLGKSNRVCYGVCEQSFTLLSNLCGLNIWKTTCGFQYSLLPCFPATSPQPPASSEISFNGNLLLRLGACSPLSPILMNWEKTPPTQPHRPSLLGGGGTRAALGWDSWARTHQCSQSWWIETLAVKASNPCLSKALFLWRAGIRNRFCWFICRSSQLAALMPLLQRQLCFWLLVIQQGKGTKLNCKQNDGVFPYIHPYFCNFCSFYRQGVYKLF